MAKQLSSFNPNLKSLLDGLVAYWKLDESSGNASDSSGNGATATNNNTVTYTGAKINNGATFNGSNYLGVSNSTVQNIGSGTADFTVSCWVKITTNNNNSDGIITFGDKDRGLRLSGSNVEFFMNNLGSAIFGMTTPIFAFGTYYHFIMRRNGNTFSFFRENVLIGNVTDSTNYEAASGTFNIGLSRISLARYMTGGVDEVGVWNRALSDIEIKALYNSGNAMAYPLGSTPNSTKLYMPLNGNSVDISGNGNHGTDTAISYVQGKFGQGARFNGSSSQILFNTVPATGINPFTASLWVKGSTLTTNMEILGWGAVATHQGFDIYMNSSNVMTANFYGGGGIASATTKLTTQNWQYVTVTYDGTNTRIYINGILEGTSSSYTSANIGTTNKFIGKDLGGGNWWNGFADEIVLENRAWTAQEISLYYRKSMLNYRAKSASIFSNFISYLLTATLQTYTLTGIANIMLKALKMIATLQTYTLTGIATTFKLGKGIVASVASFVLTGNATNLKKALKMLAVLGTYTLTGTTTSFLFARKISVEVIQFILTGISTTLKYKGWTKTQKDLGGTYTKTQKDSGDDWIKTPKD